MPVAVEFLRYGDGFTQLQAALYARAQGNDPPATYALGYFDQNPASGEPNHARAFAFFNRAAALNHLQAIEATGTAYRDGRGIEKNTLEAAKWYRRAAERGLPAAMVGLANLIVDGQVGPADPVEAFRLLQRAAAGGSALAHYRLAGYFDAGRGTTQDREAGARHLVEAARGATPDIATFIGTDLAKWNPSAELITALQRQLSEAGVYQGPRDGRLSLDVTAALGRLPGGAAR
jgi:TPR repeat protein